MATAMKGKSSKNEDKVDVAILGINPGSFLEPNIVEGQRLSLDDPTGVVVNTTLKDEGFKLGDTFQLDGTTESLTIIGFVENETYNHVASVLHRWINGGRSPLLLRVPIKECTSRLMRSCCRAKYRSG